MSIVVLPPIVVSGIVVEVESGPVVDEPPDVDEPSDVIMTPVDEPIDVEPSDPMPVLAVTIPVLAVASLVIDVPVVTVGSAVEPVALMLPLPSVTCPELPVGDAVVPVIASEVEDGTVVMLVEPPDAVSPLVDVSLPQPNTRPNEATKANREIRRILYPAGRP